MLEDPSIVLQLLLKPYKIHLDKSIKYSYSRYPQLIKGIDFGLIDDITINAVAYSDVRNEIIGMNLGVAISIPLIFNWLLSHPNLFTDIGDPAREITPSPFNIGLLTTSRRWDSIEKNGDIRLFNPRDPVRRAHALCMSIIAWDFLLYHELAHINRCHLAYLSRFLGRARPMTSWHEFRKGKTEKECKLQRVLEIDADSVSARVIGGAPGITGLEGMKLLAFGVTGGSEVSWDWQRVYHIWLRCIGLLFHIMTIIDSKANVDDPLRTHPHPDVRMEAVLAVYLATVEQPDS
jgi:hypothetical protein